MKKIWGLLLAVVMCISLLPAQTYAADVKEEVEVLELTVMDATEINALLSQQVSTESSSNLLRSAAPALCDCTINISFSSAGMYIGVTTGTNATASIVGAKDIKVERKSGLSWVQVGTCDGNYDTNTALFGGQTTYTSAVRGETYRVTVTHYATVSGISLSYTQTTPGLTCIY